MSYDRIDQVQHLLPDTARKLLDLIGLERTMRLIKAHRGRQLPVPKFTTAAGASRFEHLAEIVGQRAAEILVHHYGGDIINVPKCDAALRELRYRNLRADYDREIRLHTEPVVVGMLAERYEMTDRHVRRVLKLCDRLAPVNERQMALF